MKYAIIFAFIFFSLSCTKERDYPQKEKFEEMLNHLELDCPNDTIIDFFKAVIIGTETCYYNGIGQLNKELSIFNSSTIVDEEIKFGQKIIWGITPSSTFQYQDWIEFETSIFDVNITKEQYLDSLFAISYHKLMDRNNTKGINVTLKMFDVSQSGIGGISYPISSKFGYQKDDDYIYFKKVKKIIDGSETYYDIEMEVEAGLYYFKNKDGYIQYGKEGLWGRLENGLLKMKIKL